MKLKFTPNFQATMPEISSKNFKKNKNEQVTGQTTTTKPIMHAYRDFNINFGARLFRTPENFYEQEFNKKGMPKTMSDYLNDDYEDRKNMPPAQMMKLVFGDLKMADDLDDVKILYPDEPLFENLSDTPNKKSREGVLAEINLMKNDENQSLFKNGKDNLGLYLLKKIYVEGKTLNEINKDFKKDISVYYKGLSDITNDTVRSFGIKFPNLSFWHSFIATREDYPYTYTPRKPLDSRMPIEQKHNNTNIKPQTNQPKPPKFDIKDHDIKKLTDAMIEGNGSKDQTERKLKSKEHKIQDTEAMTFIQQYFSEVNSIVLERLGISEDMKDFFANYNDLSKDQQTKFKEYMQIPYINRLRSQMMADTIHLFFETYGADGNNEEFKDLIEYAHSIKPNRIKSQKEHDKLQQEFEEFFARPEIQAELDKVKETGENKNVEEVETVDTPETKKPLLNDSDYKNVSSIVVTSPNVTDPIIDRFLKDGAKKYIIKTSDDNEYTVYTDLKKQLKHDIEANINLAAPSFVNKFIKFAIGEYGDDEKFILTLFNKTKKLSLQDDRYILSDDEYKKKLTDLYDKFVRQNEAGNTSMLLAIMLALRLNATSNIFSCSAVEIDSHVVKPVLDLQDEENEKKIIYADKNGNDVKKYAENLYSRYSKPLTNQEIKTYVNSMVDFVKNFKNNMNAAKKLDKENESKGFLASFYEILNTVDNNQNKQMARYLKNEINEYLVKNNHGYFRCLNDNIDSGYKIAIVEYTLSNIYQDNSKNTILNKLITDTIIRKAEETKRNRYM